jgi:serine/threonine protein kinase
MKAVSEKEQQTLGRYKLLALLATGGMAEIHLARQAGIKGFERLVVVKKILPHLAAEEAFLEMFFDEARIASLLNHPNIVQIYDLGQEGDDYFMAMEYLEGESLSFMEREARKKERYMSPAVAAGIIAQVCDGLEYAHAFLNHEGQTMNIVHRDVSPQNIIVLFSGGVKLVDFGVAKAASQVHKTRAGSLKGKLSYLAPEQCLGKPVDHRTDIFALGVVLWELLTRRRLFKRDNEGATLNAVMNEEIPGIRTIRRQVPVSLEAVAMRALEKSPEKRFQSAGEMGAALRDYLIKTGEAAGTAEIAAFINGALGERAKNKKSMLEKLRTSDKKEVDVTMLNPESSESKPSRSHIEELPTPTDPSKAVSKLPPPPIEELFTPLPEKAPEPVRRKKLPTAFWGGLAGLLVGLALVLVWAMSKDISSGKEKIISAPVPEPVAAKPETPPPPPEKVVEKAVVQPEPTEAADKPEYGFLRVDTNPWSEVYLGRRRLGITPINRRKLKAGRFRLTFINKDEGIRQTITVKIRPGRTTKVVRKLKP